MKNKACIILPTYNEKDNIGKLLDQLILVFKKVQNYDMRILVIDDKSPDGTGLIVEKYMKKHKNIHILYGNKQGLGAAYIRGFRLAMNKYSVIFCMDADLQHPPNMIPDFLSEIDNGFDFVIGSRYVTGGATPDWNLKRKIISRTGNFFARVVAGMFSVHDCTSGYRAIRTSILKKIDYKYLATRGYAFMSTSLYECMEKGAKVKEIPLVFYDRKFGSTKLQRKDMIEFFLNAARLRLKTGNRFTKFLTVGFSGLLVNIILLWLLFGHLGLNLLASGAIAIELSIIFNFIFNDIYTFRDQIKVVSFIKRFLRFNAVALYGFAINLSILYLFVRWTNINYIAAHLIGIIATTMWNYIVVKDYTWRIE